MSRMPLSVAHEDAADDQQAIAAALHPPRRDQQLFPELFDVVQVVAQAVRPNVGGATAYLRRRQREELHASGAKLDDFRRIALIEGVEEPPDQRLRCLSHRH